jgi:hypothetical protein
VCEAGVLPDRLPGYLPLDDQAAVAFFGGNARLKNPDSTSWKCWTSWKRELLRPRPHALGGDLLRTLPTAPVPKAPGQAKSSVQDAF